MADDRPPAGTPALDGYDPDRPARRPAPRTLGFLCVLGLLAVVFLYDLLVLSANAPLLEEPVWPFDPWVPTQGDWLLGFSLSIVGYWGGWWLYRKPGHARAFYRRLRGDTAAFLSAAFLLGVVLVGVLGPVFLTPRLHIEASYQPPVFATVDVGLLANCLGTVVDGRCHGTIRYPLGTTFEGRSVLQYTLVATRTSVIVGLVAGVVIVPVAVTVGAVSAYFGGWVDDLLMRVVEVVGIVPPLIVYIVLRFVLGGGGDLVLLVAVFGLLSWASVARLVRNEALSYREKLFVTAAEGAGASRWHVTRRHVLPNLAPTVLTATTLQIPNLILTEAALSFLGYGVPNTPSWGTIIADGTLGTRWGSLTDVWWISLVPVVALALTVGALSVLGDSLDALIDPRGDR